MAVVRVLRSTMTANALIVSPALAAALQLQADDTVQLRFGQSELSDVTVQISERITRNNVYISSRLLTTVPLSTPMRLRIQKQGENTIRFGPFIGILARATRARSQRFMNQTDYFRALVRTGRRLALPTYIFTPQSINWEQRHVVAWMPRRGRWYRVRFPLPDVVYDRVQSRKLDLLPSTRETKARLRAISGMHIFNTGFFDKWETHQALQQTEDANAFVPETEMLKNRETIRQFTRRFRTVYVKPAGGSLGQGIYVLQRRRLHRHNVIHYGTRRVRRLRNVNGPVVVWYRLRNRVKYRRYVVQQGIAFARYRGCRFDMRILIQKGADGNWRITAMYARIAPRGSLRANLDAGGRAIRGSRVLRRIFGRGGPRVHRRVIRAAHAVAAAMEQATDGTLGELGVDIGVDRSGRAWVIEANSKPLRQMEGPARRLARTLRQPLRFAQHLSNF